MWLLELHVKLAYGAVVTSSETIGASYDPGLQADSPQVQVLSLSRRFSNDVRERSFDRLSVTYLPISLTP